MSSEHINTDGNLDCDCVPASDTQLVSEVALGPRSTHSESTAQAFPHTYARHCATATRASTVVLGCEILEHWCEQTNTDGDGKQLTGTAVFVTNTSQVVPSEMLTLSFTHARYSRKPSFRAIASTSSLKEENGVSRGSEQKRGHTTARVTTTLGPWDFPLPRAHLRTQGIPRHLRAMH